MDIVEHSNIEHFNVQKKANIVEHSNTNVRRLVAPGRGDLTDEQNSKQQIYQDLLSAKQNVKSLEDENNKLNKSLQSANRNIETLKDEKKVLQTQLISEKTESDRLTDSLRNRILQLENEKGRIQSEFVYELSKEIQIELNGRKYTGIPIWTYIENYERVSSNLQGTHGT